MERVSIGPLFTGYATHLPSGDKIVIISISFNLMLDQRGCCKRGYVHFVTGLSLYVYIKKYKQNSGFFSESRRKSRQPVWDFKNPLGSPLGSRAR